MRRTQKMCNFIEEKDNILSFTLFKVEKGREKICKCHPPHYEIDTVNRIVSCRDCAKKCGLINYCTAFISEDWGKHDVSCERATDCPILCELPEKHGRLIDADAIDWWKGEDAEGNDVFILDKRDIDKEPTIIEAECGIVEEDELGKLLCPKPISPWNMGESELWPEELQKLMESKAIQYACDKITKQRIDRYKEAERGKEKVEANMTRLEQIRKMKAEEMAEWLHNIAHFTDTDGEMIVCLLEPKTDNDMEICDSFGAWLEWLNAEAKPEEME